MSKMIYTRILKNINFNKLLLIKYCWYINRKYLTNTRGLMLHRHHNWCACNMPYVILKHQKSNVNICKMAPMFHKELKDFEQFTIVSIVGCLDSSDCMYGDLFTYDFS